MTIIELPQWQIVLLPTAVPLLMGLARIRALLRRRRRIARNHCVACGYDLRAHTPGQRCPECGTFVPPRPGNAAPPAEKRS